jgi:hypothetical protein
VWLATHDAPYVRHDTGCRHGYVRPDVTAVIGSALTHDTPRSGLVT